MPGGNAAFKSRPVPRGHFNVARRGNAIGRYAVARAGHARRPQYDLVHVVRERHPGGNADHPTQDEVAEVAVPGCFTHRAFGLGVPDEQPVEELVVLGRTGGGVNPAQRQGVGDPGRVAQQLTDGRGPTRSLAEVLGVRRVEVEATLVGEAHGRGRGDELGHGEPERARERGRRDYRVKDRLAVTTRIEKSVLVGDRDGKARDRSVAEQRGDVVVDLGWRFTGRTVLGEIFTAYCRPWCAASR